MLDQSAIDRYQDAYAKLWRETLGLSEGERVEPAYKGTQRTMYYRCRMAAKRRAKVAELRSLGFDMHQMAAFLGVSHSTIQNDSATVAVWAETAKKKENDQ